MRESERSVEQEAEQFHQIRRVVTDVRCDIGSGQLNDLDQQIVRHMAFRREPRQKSPEAQLPWLRREALSAGSA